MTDKDLLARARKEAGSIWRLQKDLDLILWGQGPSYVNLSRVYRGQGPVTSGIRAALMLFLNYSDAFKKQVLDSDRRRTKRRPQD